MTLKFEGQEIDISGDETMKICDARTGRWQNCPTDFQKSTKAKIFGIEVPVVNKEDLIKYKSKLVGNHQKEDIKAILDETKGSKYSAP